MGVTAKVALSLTTAPDTNKFVAVLVIEPEFRLSVEVFVKVSVLAPIVKVPPLMFSVLLTVQFEPRLPPLAILSTLNVLAEVPPMTGVAPVKETVPVPAEKVALFAHVPAPPPVIVMLFEPAENVPDVMVSTLLTVHPMPRVVPVELFKVRL